MGKCSRQTPQNPTKPIYFEHSKNHNIAFPNFFFPFRQRAPFRGRVNMEYTIASPTSSMISSTETLICPQAPRPRGTVIGHFEKTPTFFPSKYSVLHSNPSTPTKETVGERICRYNENVFAKITRAVPESFTLKHKSCFSDNCSTHERKIFIEDLPDLPFNFPQSDSADDNQTRSHSPYKLNDQNTFQRRDSISVRTDSQRPFGARCA